MRNLFVFMLLTSIAIFMTSCGGESEESYYPLSVGNVWNYGVTMIAEIPGTTATFTGDSQDRIVDTAELTGGTSVYELVTSITINGYSGSDTFYIHETDTAVYIYESLSDTVPDKYLELPLENSSSWIVNSSETAVVLGTIDISVPAGVYSDCREIAYIDNDDTTFVCLARGVGEVAGHATYSEADTTITIALELESATIQ